MEEEENDIPGRLMNCTIKPISLTQGERSRTNREKERRERQEGEKRDKDREKDKILKRM